MTIVLGGLLASDLSYLFCLLCYYSRVKSCLYLFPSLNYLNAHLPSQFLSNVHPLFSFQPVSPSSLPASLSLPCFASAATKALLFHETMWYFRPPRLCPNFVLPGICLSFCSAPVICPLRIQLKSLFYIYLCRLFPPKTSRET